MKDKKSYIKENKEINYDDQTSLIKLIGLFIIVYCFVGVTETQIGFILRVPFTYFFGSFGIIILIPLLLVIGIYMLLFKKAFKFFSKIQYVMLTLLGLFLLVLSTVNLNSPHVMKFSEAFSEYNERYVWNIPTNNISVLGGGIIGYLLYGLLNTITNNVVITFIVSLVIAVGVFGILISPLIKKIVSKSKESSLKKKEKKKEKDNKKIQEKSNKKIVDENEEVIEETINFNKPVSKTEEKRKDSDAFIKETELQITGQDYHYIEEKKYESKKKLSSLTSVFDDEIYTKDSKKNDHVVVKKEENFSKVFEDDFNKNVDNSTQTLYQENSITPVTSVIIEETIDFSDSKKADVIIEDEKPIVKINPQENEKKLEVKKEEVKVEEITKEEVKVEKITKEEVKVEEMVKPVIDLASVPYELPPQYLLKEASDNGTTQKNEEIAKQKAEILTNKIRELNVDAQITNFVVGPSVTRFEITLAAGVRVNTFVNLQEDFKLALGVNSIRIEAPIPGKSAIGIEVPNIYRSMVSMKDIISTLPNKKEKLFVPVGKDISGMPISVGICNMPHCLISGATNSGKSVCANTIILSLLMNYKPSEVRMIMVDPKRVEMLFYTDIPHLLCPIITEANKAMVALDKLCKRMMERFDIFAKEGVKNIASYNEKMVATNKNKMPFILLFVDELAELMLSKKSQIVEEKIQKLVQLGRAAGIHLILSTQRPDVNVITGTIKSNIPCRMTFRLSSLVDSRTVIDIGGAEKLLNNGDMLLLTPDYTGLRRVQGVYVSDKEISDVVEHCKKELGPQYDPEFLDLRTEEEKQEELKMNFEISGNNNNKSASDDALYEDIKRCVISENKASASFIQRKFALGYAKAARMIDRLEDEGIIGPENGSKGREVLVHNNEEIINDDN